MELPNFWNNKHPLANDAERLFDELVPNQGKAATLQGELLRASNKIGYDWYNNGWGCNNWSGAVCFINLKFGELPNQPSRAVIDALRFTLGIAAQYSHGEPAPIDNNMADMAVTKIHEIVVQAILNNPIPISNADDMYDYEEAPYDSWEDEET